MFLRCQIDILEKIQKKNKRSFTADKRYSTLSSGNFVGDSYNSQ